MLALRCCQKCTNFSHSDLKYSKFGGLKARLLKEKLTFFLSSISENFKSVDAIWGRCPKVIKIVF